MSDKQPIITTVPNLMFALGNIGSLQSELEIYDTSGNRYNIVDIYVPDDSSLDPTEAEKNIVCIDIEKVAS